MKIISTSLDGVILLTLDFHEDSRGYFMETYSKIDMNTIGITSDFVQDNESYTKQKGTLRGIHFQNAPMAQAKLIRVTQGAVLDVAVDLRKGSPTYLQWLTVELNAENGYMLYIPRGYGHGFLTLTDNVKFCYKVDNPYSREHDRTIRFDDPAIGIAWNIENPVLSLKDQSAPLLGDCDCNFVYERI